MSRITQIRNLREQCKSLNPVSANDDTRWFIQLVDKNMQELYKIFVYIPRDFPTAPPQITVSIALNHPWVHATTKVVQHPQVIPWNPKNDLSAIVIDVLREFTTKKPAILQDDSLLRRGSAQSSASQSTPSIIEIVAMPSIPLEFPELKSLPLDDLEALERDSLTLDSFIDSMALMNKYKEMKDAERAVTLQRAQDAIRQQERLDCVQNQIQEDFENMANLRSELELVMQERDSIMSHYTPKYLARDLSVLAEKVERESGTFIEADELTDDVKSKFLQQRALYHKAMALGELLTVHSGSRIIGSPRSATK